VSRDEIVRDEAYQQVRQVLGEAILAHLEHLSLTDPRQLKAIVVSHNTLIKAWAVESDDFFDRIADLVQFDANIGKLTIPDYLHQIGDESTIYYFKEAGSGTQQKVLFGARNMAIIDASYGAEEAFLQKYASRRDIQVRRLDAEDEFIFETVSDPDGKWRSLEGQYRAMHKIDAKVVKFKPMDLPAVLVSKPQDSDIDGLLDSMLSASEVSGQIRELLQSMKKEQEGQSSDMVTKGTILYLNAENTVIQSLREMDQHSQVFHLALIVLYNNAVLFGQHAITAENAIKMCQSNNEAVALMIEQALEVARLQMQLTEA
jgi:HSP90 family molecular chaperone